MISNKTISEVVGVCGKTIGNWKREAPEKFASAVLYTAIAGHDDPFKIIATLRSFGGDMEYAADVLERTILAKAVDSFEEMLGKAGEGGRT